MAVAALYDIYGNLHALDAVPAELRELRPDVVLIGGDMPTPARGARFRARRAQARVPS